MTEVNIEANEPVAAPPSGAVSISDSNNPAANGNGEARPNLGTVLEAEGEGAPAPATWPEDWRERLAAGDESFKKIVSRYSSPETFAKAYGSLRQQLASGELIKKLPDNASEQEVAEWRAQMGLPEKPDGYQLTRVMGYEWQEGDKENLNSFIAAAHGSNFTQKQLDTALDWYGKQVVAQEEKRFEQDTLAKQACEDHLRTEWGPQFRGNIGLMKRFIESDIPDGAGQALVNARLEDGSRLIDQPWFAKWMVQMAQDVHGEAAFAGGSEGVASLASRKAEIEKIMSTDYPAYARDKNMQKEYAQIIEREERSRR
jgi:hypothetical protein